MPGDRRLITETPSMHQSKNVQSYISQEVSRPCKQWIVDVLNSKREAERVKLRTDNFVVLPDVDSSTKRMCSSLRYYYHLRDPSTSNSGITTTPLNSVQTQTPWPRIRRHTSTGIHWLAVATDLSLRTLRDLRGHHLPMLQTLYTQTCKLILEETGIKPTQIMAYIHYPPSVYQLHVHFKHPVATHASHDAFRIHHITTIINNLTIDPDYYAKSTLQLPVYPHTELYTALGCEEAEPLHHLKPSLGVAMEPAPAVELGNKSSQNQPEHDTSGEESSTISTVSTATSIHSDSTPVVSPITKPSLTKPCRSETSRGNSPSTLDAPSETDTTPSAT
jgi:hypothetical protein